MTPARPGRPGDQPGVGATAVRTDSRSWSVNGGSASGGRRGPRSTAKATSGLKRVGSGPDSVITLSSAWVTSGRPVAVSMSRFT